MSQYTPTLCINILLLQFFQWKIQVKSSRTRTPSSPNKKDLGRLKQSATKTRSTPVIASVTTNGIEYKSARSGRKLNPIKKKRS